ncbi:MAG: translation initiation factor IF-2 [Phycisphaeraceae bacterium]|nr:MAG: translation initiation factor IF-2 [Phycisphaeraceae bacterium]
MAKKAQLRVHKLAKELGISSKDVIAKCEAEGIPGIENHLSPVSIGLAATIREWFSKVEDADEEESTTAVETAEKVDLEEARKKAEAEKKRRGTRRRSTAATKAKSETTDESKKEEVKLEQARVEAAIKAQQAEAQARADVVGDDSASDETDSNTGSSQGETSNAAARPNVPDRPDVIAPAGPRVAPEKTKLAGPKVVRIEKPDPVAPPRRQREGGPPGSAPATPGGPSVGRSSPGGGGVRNTRRRDQSRGSSGAGAKNRGLGEVTPFDWRQQDYADRERRLQKSEGFLNRVRRDVRKKDVPTGEKAKTLKQTGGSATIQSPVVLKELSAITGVKVNDIVRRLVKKGQPLMTGDGIIADELAMELMIDWGIELEVLPEITAEMAIEEAAKNREMADARPCSPVVTILGHVDHGKTSLLDAIRDANVADGEAGGITQATSAFRVGVEVGSEERSITFIDTPGHEAFTEMRARGAEVTDVVILVVAADDGVMPQTVESINHAKAAGVPIVVALNKIDKAEATDGNIQRILGQLAENGLNPVEWGGEIEVVRVSAINRTNLDGLLEIVDLQAQVLELQADYAGFAEGTVLEAQVEEGRGPVARLIVQQGQINKGDFIVVGRACGRVRDIVNDRGERVNQAGPGDPIAISGIDELPDSGDNFYCVKNLKQAEAAAEERRQAERERNLAGEKVTLDNIFNVLAEQKKAELPIIVKGDVFGSIETLKGQLGKIGSEEVKVTIKHSAVGGINDSDVTLAEATGAIIIGFNVTASGKARKQAEAKGVDIRYYDVIYELIDDVKRAAEGLLDPELKLEVLGQAEVRAVFRITKVGMVAGCYVTSGSIRRNAQIRVTRDDIVIEKDRRLNQLKRFKEDAKEVASGNECGMLIDGYDDIKEGDVLECYLTQEVRRTLD